MSIQRLTKWKTSFQRLLLKWVWWILWKNKYAGSEIIQMDKPICWIMHHHLRVNDTAFINLLHVFYKLNKLQERVNIGYTLTQFIWISKWYVWIKEMTNKVRRREVVYGTAPNSWDTKALFSGEIYIASALLLYVKVKQILPLLFNTKMKY